MRSTTLSILCFCFAIQSWSQSPNLNRENIGKDGTAKLLGKIDGEGLRSKSYGKWFVPEYYNYTVDSTRTTVLKRHLPDFEILLFMGTWCGDSRREVPRFYKILDVLGFPKEQLTAVAVDYEKPMYKKSPGGEEKGMDIRKVPTFIFLKDGKEVNRIVESPLGSLEADMEKIVKGAHYVPNYKVVRVVPID